MSVTAPCAGSDVANVSTSPGSGSVTSAARSMFVGTPASTRDDRARRDRRAVGGRQHLDGDRAGDEVALLVVDGVGERRQAGEAVVGVERHGSVPGAVGGRRGRAAPGVVAAREVQRVAVGVAGLGSELDRDRRAGRRLGGQRADLGGARFVTTRTSTSAVSVSPVGVGDRVRVAAGRRPGERR